MRLNWVPEPRKHWRLRSQLALALVSFLIVAFLLLHFGTLAVLHWLSAADVAALPEPARRAQQAIANYQVPDISDQRVLLESLRELNMKFAVIQNWVVAVLFLATTLLGSLAAFALARRLATPIEQIASAVRRVAAGELTARANLGAGQSGETAALASDFNQMADALESYDRELREATASIAHELRTPLTILRGRLQGMRDGLFPSRAQDLEGLISHVDSLSRIVEDLQTVSLASVSQLRLDRVEIDLANECDSLLALIEPTFREVGLTLERDFRAAPTLADPQRFRQIFFCLIDNARRYGADGGVIRITTGSEANNAIFQVLDRGKGLPDGPLERMFERFWRNDQSRSRDTGGSGLGLSVVQALAKAHAGGVMAARREGGGAAFTVWFPLHPSKLHRLSIKAPPEAAQ
jgi:two-component system sensor histidine kinase AdeS